jgi:hypothetical protein
MRHARDGIALQGQAIKANPSNARMFWRHISIGRDPLPAASACSRPHMSAHFSHLFARSRLRPHGADRCRAAGWQKPTGLRRLNGASRQPKLFDQPVLQAQLAHFFWMRFRPVGERDQADEDANSGMVSDAVLHDPARRPLAWCRHITTAELPRLIAGAKPA